ncbi:hypothetical protein PHET_10982 [Paragonimus heterotremus]|uniref:Uncharacterized protein n=1 Tax=Paragonimus heterotremus TaxID=100268 RepID=A0A8J4WDU0_9TREM|nr:hypothetical protein PHET_10982 [Paragonimus heterotremus]
MTAAMPKVLHVCVCVLRDELSHGNIQQLSFFILFLGCSSRGRGGRGRGRGQFSGAGHEREFINRGGQRGAFSRPPRPPFAGFQPRPPVPGSEIGLPVTTIGSLPSQQPRGWGPSRLSSPQIQVM